MDTADIISRLDMLYADIIHDPILIDFFPSEVLEGWAETKKTQEDLLNDLTLCLIENLVTTIKNISIQLATKASKLKKIQS